MCTEADGWHAHAQVSTKLKVGVMFDHNGTYMEGFGFAYRELQVTVEIADNDELAVTLNGKALQLPQSQADLEVIPYVERGEFLLLWQRHREGLGNAVELTTGTLAAHKRSDFSSASTSFIRVHMHNILSSLASFSRLDPLAEINFVPCRVVLHVLACTMER